MTEFEQYFAVEPITTCEHYQDDDLEGFREYWQKGKKEILKRKCKLEECEINDENWYCLKCQELYCSRYKNKHMLEHKDNYIDHQVAFSLSDGSFWCYECDSYIDGNKLRPLRKLFSSIKFENNEPIHQNILNDAEQKEKDKNEDKVEDQINEITQKVEEMKLDDIETIC